MSEPRTDWSDSENDLIVADYFAMLTDELAGRRYSKTEHRRALRQILHHRSDGSIEFKHQNISAVLVGLGQTWIEGYKPAFSFQASLVDAVVRWFEERPDWSAASLMPSSTHPPKLQAAAEGVLWIGPPPTVSNRPPPKEADFLAAVARKYDVAARDARDRALGRAGEERVFHHEIAILKGEGRDDLARKVQWTSAEEGDGAGYDIKSFEPNGRERLIEVKTTNGWERTPFHISRNELAVADACRESWRLLRLWNFAREPKAYEIQPPLDAHVALTPTSFLASPL